MRHNDQQKGAEREGPSSNSEGLVPGSTQVEAESSLGKVLQKVFLLNSRISSISKVIKGNVQLKEKKNFFLNELC